MILNNNIIDKLKFELLLMGFNNKNLMLEKIRNKDGVFVYRVIIDKQSYVIKYFANIDFTREIKSYEILKSVGVPTINTIAQTKHSILLEDICNSDVYRLGIAEDLKNENSARMIAKWYKILHGNGENVFGLSNLYNETDIIQKDRILKIKEKSNTQNNQVWDLILDNFNLIKNTISQCRQTLTYNDFYWTNLIVSKNITKAMMFDYNLLGRGYRYSDIRNVCSSLSTTAQRVFLDEYGSFDETEKIIDDGISILVTLIFAFQKEKFPEWGKSSLEITKNGELFNRINRIINLI
ncbi:MAG: hypothetical protein COA82_07885 [Alkaliphilus sp.]|nr:MAG: hypothetical protein COA82_07885 [Alkaliphilus sp.]